MKKALISVYHKEGIADVGRLLADAGWQIISTGGTARFLRDAGVETTDVYSLTGYPEILDGRVKTLHPHVFGPILAKDTPAHHAQLRDLKLDKIDLVIVNFYPFEESLAQKERGLEFMVEQIDIGGPAMVRAAAKNFASTVVVVSSDDYLPVATALARQGDLDAATRRALAQKAFAYTSFYDSLVAGYLATGPLPDFQGVSGRRVLSLRYGENPHQQAALYSFDRTSPFDRLQKLQGKELSFNNILDAAMVYEVQNEFAGGRPFAVIVKHQNPCGAAVAETQAQAFRSAVAGAPRSAYGGIVGFNAPLSGETAEAIQEIFFEVIIAPGFSEEAREVLHNKRNLRLLQIPLGYREGRDLRIVPGGFLLQERDRGGESAQSFQPKSSRRPTPAELADAEFGWKMVRFVKSNAIVLVKGEMLIAVGAGQMSRVDAVELAMRKCSSAPQGAVLVSDAFFPFPDSIELAAHYGITVVVEPGGSVKDDEVIAASEKHGITLLFSGVRHFRH